MSDLIQVPATPEASPSWMEEAAQKQRIDDANLFLHVAPGQRELPKELQTPENLDKLQNSRDMAAVFSVPAETIFDNYDSFMAQYKTMTTFRRSDGRVITDAFTKGSLSLQRDELYTRLADAEQTKKQAQESLAWTPTDADNQFYAAMEAKGGINPTKVARHSLIEANDAIIYLNGEINKVNEKLPLFIDDTQRNWLVNITKTISEMTPALGGAVGEAAIVALAGEGLGAAAGIARGTGSIVKILSKIGSTAGFIIKAR